MTHRRRHNLAIAGRRAGFTLVELLVVIGIALLLMAIILPAVNLAYNRGVRTRMAADLQSIVIAIEAYRQDHGDIPRVLGAGSTPNDTGAVVLCRALVAPGPAGADGQDGYGFRTRAAINGVPQGKKYGPYLDPDKFKIDTTAANPKILDRNGKPILYFPGFKSADVTANNGYIAALPYTGNATTAVRPMFNANDNDTKAFDEQDATPTAADGLEKFRYIMGCNPSTGGANGTKPDGGPYTPAYTGEYLLWSAGPDERYGIRAKAPLSAANKCDDVANFERDMY